jgi:hypothetical protein
MTFVRLFYLVQSVVLLVFLTRQIRIGYRRRRPYWTRVSWLRFTGVCVGGFLVVGTIGWFATADPVRPFPGAKARPAQSIRV